MKSTLLVPALIAAATLGCADSSTALNRVHIGMTRAEIVGLLGQPDSTSAQANVEYLTYYLYANTEYSRDQPYFVRLVEGKVESFGRFAPMFDLQNRPVTGSVPTSVPIMGQPVTPAATRAPAPTTDLGLELLRLKQLHDQGVLTDDEFARAKAKVIGGN